MDRCPNCSGELFEEDPVRGDSICKGCGCCCSLPELDAGKEYVPEAAKRPLAAQSGIVIVAPSGNGNTGTGNNNKLQRTQNMVESAAVVTKERNLADGFQNIKHFENLFSLPRIVVNSCRDLMSAFNQKQDKKVHGVRSEAFALAVVYLGKNKSTVHDFVRTIVSDVQGPIGGHCGLCSGWQGHRGRNDEVH
jgi:transcription initiation factor TFIIIB Brf1 subunit/transcription initiation factor TFIIB